MIAALAPLERWLEKGEHGEAPDFAAPGLSPETIAAVEKIIAAYPDESVARALAAILGEVQVLQSRSRSFSAEGIRSWSIAMKDNVVMAASIVARCENLFDFARTGSGYAEPSRSHLQNVLSRAKIRQHLYPRVWESLERFGEDESPSGAQSFRRRLAGLLNRLGVARPAR